MIKRVLDFDFREGYAYWFIDMHDELVRIIVKELNPHTTELNLNKRVKDLVRGNLCLACVSGPGMHFEYFSSTPMGRENFYLSNAVMFGCEGDFCFDVEIALESLKSTKQERRITVETTEDINGIVEIIKPGDVMAELEVKSYKLEKKYINIFNNKVKKFIADNKNGEIPFEVYLYDGEYNQSFLSKLSLEGYQIDLIEDQKNGDYYRVRFGIKE